MELMLGRTYRLNKDLDGKKTFPFEYETGIFFSRTAEGWPRFNLNNRGTECAMNLEDECFELVD